MLPAVHQAVIAGAQTRWWEYGPPGAPTLVTVHGYRGEHHGLEPIIEHLPGLRVLSPDLPGFGESGPLPRRHSIEAYADWLVELSDRLGAFSVLGHSFGSIVVSAALDRGLTPERVILVNPIAAPALHGGPRALGTLATLGWYRLAGLLPERAGRRTLSARLMVDSMSALLTKTRDPQLRRWIRDEHRRRFSSFHTTRTVIEGFRASVSDHVAAHAAAFTMPTLLIAAEQDQIGAIRDVRRLHEAIPTSDLVVLDEVGHLIHYEQPVEAATAIERFLA